MATVKAIVIMAVISIGSFGLGVAVHTNLSDCDAAPCGARAIASSSNPDSENSNRDGEGVSLDCETVPCRIG